MDWFTTWHNSKKIMAAVFKCRNLDGVGTIEYVFQQLKCFHEYMLHLESTYFLRGRIAVVVFLLYRNNRYWALVYQCTGELNTRIRNIIRHRNILVNYRGLYVVERLYTFSWKQLFVVCRQSFYFPVRV